MLPGLSESRVERLTVKRDIWCNGGISDLKSMKHRILEKINQIIEVCAPDGSRVKCNSPITEVHHAVMIAAILQQQDEDTELARQATFKLNGCRTVLRTAAGTQTSTGNKYGRRESEAVSDLPANTLRFLLKAASGPAASQSQSATERTALRADVRSAILKWMGKDANEFLPEVALNILRCSSTIVVQNEQGARGIMYSC